MSLFNQAMVEQKCRAVQTEAVLVRLCDVVGFQGITTAVSI
jgi:hypothetical protein